MYSDEILKDVEQFAYAYMSKSEISRITRIDPDDFLDEKGSVFLAFDTGRLRRKAEFNNEVIALSKQLSSPAMNIEVRLAEQARLEDLGI